MAGSEIKVTPEAVVEAVGKIDALRGELGDLKAKVHFGQSKGEGASSLTAASAQVSQLIDAVDELLGSDRRRLAEGLVAFEGADSAAAQMMRGLTGASEK